MSAELFSIKPLEWNQIRTDAHEDGEWWTASTVFGSFDVERDTGLRCYRWRYCIDEYYDEDSHDCESIEDGKRAAEAYFRERLLPALERIR